MKTGERERQILVVCTGNTCRSPMAAGWLSKKLAGKGWVVQSAGVAAWPGQPAAAEAIEAMREIGCDISGHRTRAVETKMVADARYILVMTAGHQREIVARFPLAENKVFLVHGFGVQEACDVSDPVGMPLETYRRTRDEIVQALGDFLLYLAENGEISH
ncbi:MAG TPA: low molecular weight protein arginine phosphatase [Kiritimatiellia bacterium]|nr:low molecular weight protein arginine phosphatase [Kiritimatiellia bacterium]OQC59389.1 MAG: Low molecular weight protein-tyrosine-phosphatase YwlE [Verrucomicrobia bacterium ADurb.Bin018]MBP9572222.1 low molecular weight protein arginine phosphatase [Kiritimatiellia bacterium]HOE00510.1 low molecular weight protein arginine phosphatase [Kiritimatiellia bacterium]HOE37010.1 low molecular weight protein arginine phosphatase [Kiritimatiellia bacterium]